MKTFTVEMAEMARSMMVAETPVISRSVDKRGVARVWERAWTNMRTGTVDRITRVRDQERMKARIRHARHVVRYCSSIPVASEEAILTLSVSLKKELRENK